MSPVMQLQAMPPNALTATVRLLEAVRSFTAERERDALVSTLIRTLLEVLPASAIEFHPRGASPADGFRMERESSASGPMNSGEMKAAATAWVNAFDKRGGHPRPETTVVGAGYSLHPLADGQGVVGLVAIEHAPGQQMDLAIVDALLRIYRNFAVVIDDSHRDTLTGLLNRKTFEQSIQTVLLESKQAFAAPSEGTDQRRRVVPDACHWLAVMDIDHFKRINDSFGHLYGDEVLILLSRLMMQSFRRSDRLYRFGGEEFAVLLSPCSAEDVRMVLERFRTAVQNHVFPQIGQVTISIGFVAIKAQDIPATVVAHADEALYASKHGGRNRVTAYADIVADTSPAGVQGSSIDLF